jgi:hypothetical protein
MQMTLPDLNKVWALFMSDPVYFLTMLAIIGSAVGSSAWWLRHFIGKERIATLEGRIATLEERLQLSKDKHDISTAEVQKLTANSSRLEKDIATLKANLPSASQPQLDAVIASSALVANTITNLSSANSSLGVVLTTNNSFPLEINVHKIWFQIPKLDDDGIIHINIDMFNGTPYDLCLQSINGQISVSRNDKNHKEAKLGDLVPPRFADLRITHIKAFSNFSFILTQELPKRLNNLNDAGAKYIFNFEHLNIIVQSVKDQTKVTRLPLWDAAELERIGTQIITSYTEILGPGKPLRHTLQ